MEKTELDVFKDWLKERQRHFEEVNALPADIAHFALSAGFSQNLVRQWETSERFRQMGLERIINSEEPHT